MNQEVEKLYNILAEILGESKSGFSERQYQYQFPCPKCIERDGYGEARKFNLEVNLQRQVFQCWKCSSIDDDMHGSIIKLIRMYGNEKLLSQYKEIIHSIRESELYKLKFNDNDFNIDTSVIENEELKFPQSFTKFNENGYNYKRALDYLKARGIGWDIINEYQIGYTTFQNENKKGSYRIIIPSYDALGTLNYWVGRDYLPQNNKSPYKRLKYDNPKVEKKNIIFNEEKIQWDADITLVEGPFDHIVVPNSIPLLGKVLTQEFKLYWDIIRNANACVNIFLDGDAFESARELYKTLNHGRLYNKVRYILVNGKDDPSSIYQKWGKRGIMKCLANPIKIDEVYLITK